MRSIFSIFFALYLCLTLQNVCLVFGQNFDVQLCNTQRDSGPCKALIPMYAYDNQTDSCIQFIYGGCGGNGNRFTTQEECKNSCQTGQVKPNSQKEESIQKCLLEPETGICMGYFQRYHFNAKTGRCEQFVYGGCGGNENNFKSIEECVESCEHKIESTISEYVEEDPCSFNATVGPCKALLHRFYYDRDTGKCIPFIYGGCNGNANNFEVIEECEKKCISKKTDTYYSDEKSICELNLDSGPCEALIPRYFFDHKLGKCEKFTYGGCQGNANNFKTIDECQQICANQTIPSIDTTIDTTKLIKEGCEQKSEPGTCRGYFPRYYYDLDTKDCQQFIYGGCNGNINNFETYESCQEFCMN